MVLVSGPTETQAFGLSEVALLLLSSRDLASSSLTVCCYVLIKQRQEGQAERVRNHGGYWL